VHHNEDEAFWVLEGELTFEVGEETMKASPGSFLFGPKDVLHRRVGACQDVVSLTAPGLRGVDLRYQRAGEGERPTAPPEGPPSEGKLEQLGAFALQYGCEILG